MTERDPRDTKTTAAAWASARGDIWRSVLDDMEAMLLPIDEPLIDALALDGPLRIADVGCGGGATSRAIARRAAAGSVVHGFDVSPGLVETARQRAAECDVEVAFSVADMSTAAPPGEPFDRLASRFGVMFFEDPSAAFRNLASWLAPGGRFAFAVWGPPADNPMSVVRNVVASLVDLPPSDPQAPGPFRYADADAFRTLLLASGFTDVQAHPWRGSLGIGGNLGPDAAAAFALRAFSVADPLSREDDAVREQAHQALRRRFEAHVTDGAVRLPASVHLVTGSTAR